MKLACQEGLVPGQSFAEKLANLHRWGYEGVELNGRGLRERVPEIKAALAASPVRASTICGGFTPLLLSPDKPTRDQTIAEMRALLAIAAEVGAVGLIFVPLFGKPEVPDLSPLSTPVELERALLVKLLRQELAPFAEDAGVLLLLEPLNRYEAHIPKDLREGVAICQEVGSPGLKLMADFFHMSIEEADIARSLAEAGDFVRHIHLADSNRQLPGLGHTDFATPFATLQHAGYQGYMALECRVPPPADETLPESARYLKRSM
ncbi:MAG: sugar phosphate isomerase/epimerase [Chloroflexi bacterium]|nr:sugar phosphate isomerase/epimerase [Chloroflexota bacterium]